MPKTYGYYIYLNKLLGTDIPALRYDGFLTEKIGDTSTILKWNCGDSIESVKERLRFDVEYCLNHLDPNPQSMATYKVCGERIYKASVAYNEKLLEFGKISFDQEIKVCEMEAVCTSK